MFSWSHDLLLKLLCLSLLAGSALVVHGGVTYDGRSLIINGRRELIFSGSIHYPRSTPQQWEKLIDKAKHGGLNTIETYVFWNLHEPVEGQLDFNGNYDLVKFIKTIQEAGMWVILRLGPFIEAEWNHGGLPYWLREVQNITFRTNNEPFKNHMKKYTRMMVDMMKKEKLFASQGGPIIVSQIENEYNNIQLAFKAEGSKYVQWAGKMALGMDTGIPWVMCKQWDAPDPVINACNGRNCGDTFTGPNKPNKPSLWTENWTAQYRVFGDPPSQRTAEDLAYAVARWFSKNGTLVNYYMYHGGTNFGRTSSSFVQTRYYDEAPLDEFGLLREPKWGHLKDLHSALRLCRNPLLWGETRVQILGNNAEARIYQRPGTNVCAAFLTNNDTKNDATVTFNGEKYYLPRRSISILPDCKTVVFNTAKVVAQHNTRYLLPLPEFQKSNRQWEMWREPIRQMKDADIKYPACLEHYNMTKDTSDYLWYTTSLYLNDNDMPFKKNSPVMKIFSLGHAMHAFVNGLYIGSEEGDNVEKSFSFKKAVMLRPGVNHISLLSMTVGYPDSGAYMERKIAGIHQVRIQGLNTGTLDLSLNDWGHKVGLEGEKLRVYTQGGSHRVQWTQASGKVAMVWYKRYFDAPPGNEPVALDMTSMAKGMVWVNGHSIGRYWVSFLSPLGKPSQSEYHIPREFLKPSDNLLVVLEESGGNPEQIQLLRVSRDTICSSISDNHPPHVKNWKRSNNKFHAVVDDAKPTAHLKCPNQKVIEAIEFASYGDPEGYCGSFKLGTCNAAAAQSAAEKACLGKTSCNIRIDSEILGSDNCPSDMSKTFVVQARCIHDGVSNA
ncbi:beta-galactosidase 13-like [Aristolochia californica]|uniref:beta-galactosidase 13-like n=1 Tax=Aristolochia californica TaxID=171875 RepID=UPI0035DAA8C7